jgi:hypothetical protein
MYVVTNNIIEWMLNFVCCTFLRADRIWRRANSHRENKGAQNNYPDPEWIFVSTRIISGNLRSFPTKILDEVDVNGQTLPDR